MSKPYLVGGGRSEFNIPAITMSKQIKDNVLDTLTNHRDTLQHYFEFASNVVTSPIPCKLSKKITNQLCGYKDDFGLIDFTQIQKLVDLSKKQIDLILKSSDIQSNTRKLQKNIRNIDKINKENTESLLCTISKFLTDKICKTNEITINILHSDIQKTLFGMQLIPTKVNDIISDSQDIIDSKTEISGEVLDEIESIKDSITDISNITDIAKATLSDVEVGDVIDIAGDVSDRFSKKENTDSSSIKQSNKSKQEISTDSRNKERKTGKNKLKKNRSRSRSQLGGNNVFDYIMHPVSNKSVSINTKAGKNIIKNYMAFQ